MESTIYGIILIVEFELYSSLYLSGLNVLTKRLLDCLLNYRYNGYDMVS